ncbi:LamG-like jellyroll fold domain-containing protein [Aeromonas veronii]
MAGVWKRDGTVAVTNGSKKVTGTGTTFADAKNGVAKGHLFCMTTGTTVDLYEVDYVVSNTELHLVQAFRGTTGTGKAYEIITTFSDSIPEFARKLNSSLSYYQSQSDMVQQLFTSDAAEITVTAPDGTTHKLIPWKRVTSEGEGQAARAKVEADRAKTEADRSGTEADRAAGIVAAAALPMPDVWAPLSDSLRLITGYGRDVLVGSDVVARMVNFSRNSTATYIGKDGLLKTAAANEPRFEKEGLLIEGQSQNIFIASDAIAAPSAASVSTSVVTDEGIAAFTSVINKTKVVRAIQTVNAPGNTITLQSSMFVAGKTYTASVWCRTDAGASIQFRLQPNGFSPPPIIVTGDKWVRRSVTFTIPADYSSAGGLLFSINQGEYLGIPLYFTGLQVEELPFASSYIPTAGAAVTRAADVCWMPNALNVTPDYGDITITMEVRRNVAIPSSAFPRLIHISDRQFVVADSARIMARGGGVEQVNISVAATGTRERIAATIKGNTIACFLNGVKATLPQAPILPVSNGASCFIGSRNGLDGLFGHVRNVRIWQRTLSDDQIKAAA